MDPELAEYLDSKKLGANVYAFAKILSLSGSVPPLSELLHLWDVLIAFGIHLNILCIVAQVISLREQLLATKNPMLILGHGELHAQQLLSKAMQVCIFSIFYLFELNYDKTIILICKYSCYQKYPLIYMINLLNTLT